MARRSPAATIAPGVQGPARALILAHTRPRDPWRPPLPDQSPDCVRSELSDRIDRLQRALPADAHGPEVEVLAWAARRVVRDQDPLMPWLDELLDQPLLAAVALSSVRARRVVTCYGPELEQAWSHWIWLTALADVRPGESPLGAREVRHRLCPGLPAALFTDGWPAWLDVLTLHGWRHWDAPGLTPADRARLGSVLWSCSEVPPPPGAWAGHHGPRAGVRHGVPGLDHVWAWLEVLDLDPVQELRLARRRGMADRDTPVLDPGVWTDLLVQAGQLRVDLRPRWAGPGRPTGGGWHDQVSVRYRDEQAQHPRPGPRRPRDTGFIVDDTAYFDRRREEHPLDPRDEHGGGGGLERLVPDPDRTPWHLPDHPAAAALTGTFLTVAVAPVWPPDALLGIGAEMHNCAAMSRRDVALGREVFLVGRDQNGRARLLCRLECTDDGLLEDGTWAPLQPGTLRVREVKWAYNRRLDEVEAAAWVGWLTKRGVPV